MNFEKNKSTMMKKTKFSKLNHASHSSKGQTDTPFIFGLMVFIAFLIFLTTQIQTWYPQYQTIGQFDMVFFGGQFIAVAGTCAIATGIACAGALIFFSVLSFFFVQNTVLNTLIFIPISVTVAFIISKLARGSSA